MTRKQAPPIWNSFAIDPSASLSRQEQIAAYVRNAVLSGAIKPGDRLPSTRALAAELDVARQTIVLAFERLFADGFLEAQHGAGTFIASKLPIIWGNNHHDAHPGIDCSTKELEPRLSKRGDQIRSLSAYPTTRRSRLLAPGIPELENFPSAVWGKLSTRFWRNVSADQLDYSDPAGFLALRIAIAKHLGATRGLVCTAEDIIITAGAQQGIDLAARLLLDPGDRAWVEDPGYVAGRNTLRAAGAEIIPVPVDKDGIDVSAGEARFPSARLAMVSPSHQFPLGVTLSLARRLALLDWARRTGAWIIEDDYDGDFRYGGSPLQPLRALEAGTANSRVVYIGTFSKILAPGLRIGFVIAPRGTADAFIAARVLLDRQLASPQQAVLADFMMQGHFSAHLRRMRKLFAERRHALLKALECYCPDFLDWGDQQPEMGIHLAAKLRRTPHGVHSDAGIYDNARKEGIETPALSGYCMDNNMQGLVIGYGRTEINEIDDAVKKLSIVIAKSFRT